MQNKNDNKGIITHLETVIEGIETEQTISKKACSTLLEDIDNLQALRLKKLEDTIMEKDIELIYEEFSSTSDNARLLLNAVLSTISEGRIPDLDTIEKMDDTIDVLRDKYESLVTFATQVLEKDELVEEHSPAEDYYNAVLNCKTVKCKENLAEIKSLLDNFIAVRALTEQYAVALQPFQEKAKDLIGKISNLDVEVEVAIKESENAKLFLDALAITDKGSTEWMEITPKIATAYASSPLVFPGLSLGQYVLDSNVSDVSITPEEDKSITKPEEKTVMPEVSEQIKHAKDKPQEGLLIAGEEELDNSEDELKNEVKESLFARTLREHGIIEESKRGKNKAEVEISANEEKNVSSKVFMNDIRKGNANVAVRVLENVSSGSGCTEEYLNYRINGKPEAIQITLDYLIRKGYIRKYSTANGELFTASPRLIEAIRNKEASKFISVKQSSLDDFVMPNSEDVGDIDCRIAYCNISTIIEKEYPKHDVSSAFTVENGLVAAHKIFRGKKESKYICIGAFNPKNGNWDNFENAIEDIKIAKGKNIEGVIFAAYDDVLAKELCKAFSEVVGFEFDSEIEFYALNENEIYDASEKNVNTKEKRDEAKESENNELITEPTQEPDTAFDEPASVEQASENMNAHVDYVEKFLSEGLPYAALTYAKADANEGKRNKLYTQLAYAMNDPAYECSYSSDNLYRLIEDNNELENALVLSAAVRTFFSNQVRYDYNIKATYNALNDYSLLEQFPSLKTVMYDMSEFKDKFKVGLDFYADYRKKSQTELENEMKSLRLEAEEFYNKNVIGIKKEKTSHKRFIETNKRMFSASGELGECIKLVADGEKELTFGIEAFLKNNFYETDSDITPETISSELLWKYIQHYWDIAGEKMAVRKKEDLKHHLKNNIIMTTTKAIQILARWCCLVERCGAKEEDAGDIAYKKLKKSLLDNISTTIAQIEMTLKNEKLSTTEIAGLRVLLYALCEIQSRINGQYLEVDRRFTYVDFLRTDDVILDDNYLPDMESNSTDLEGILMQNRVLSHVNKMKESMPTFEERLEEILDEQGDDYGSAQLIVDYLSLTGSSNNLDEYKENITSGEAYAKETADLRKVDFIGELELAQSYGQLNSTTEDQKEKMLNVIDDWHDWAVNNSNFGFFKKVIDEFMKEIRKNAKIREKDILAELEAYKKAPATDIAVEDKEKKIAKVQEAIKLQNYTVAEDLLSRNDVGDINSQSVIDEDFLKDFIENYDDFYKPVASKTSSLAHLVNARTRNKEERGAKRLADNWLPGGSKIGTVRLGELLKHLGFDVEEIVEQKSQLRYEEYKVRTVGTFKRQRNSYSHPIAALGSGAAESGLRVVCINGAYDTDGLIDIMKQFGNAKHTLILLDFALSLRERRKLARKSKNALGDKLFAVIDRTVMMYLIRNYDENKINRMLASLIVPFAYYQPYVWESANYMPPEIFMGRKIELEKIKSPTGVNIVYGGRQLGKSALLKKAKEDIDWNENGDRAIYIDIKGLNYEDTARKISHELFDQYILTEDIDTTDWDVLARAIKRKLQNDNKIPYLLLLLDEADAFIESCSQVNYKPFDSLKELQNIGTGRFKFVVAGLRDIVRFKRNALENNSVLTHLEPMTVTPFKFSEARELMEIPLHYLGIRFPKDKESLITLIMATTNYFPGLIQMYCAKLVDAMRNKDYAGYDEVDSPIYELTEEHIKKVLADSEFMQQIREKYEITLKLDEDNYYHLIALVMAWLYHNKGLNESYSASDIHEVGVDYDIKQLVELDASKIENFMEELKELNVLRSTEEHKYRFTRFTFFQMMGTSDEVDNSLSEYMGV